MANENDYDGGEIKILEGLEAVRKRPGMYIGSTSASGLHHLVWEIVDNSVDEAMAGFCTEIQVTVHADNSITVVDNGRGIPVDEHPIKKIPTLEVVMTILHAGGKFDNSAYKVSGGLHGVGISVVNALSKRVVVQVCRDGNIYEMEFSRGKTVKKMEVVGTSETTGTTVSFWPDDEIFETCIYDFDTLHNRLQETAFLNKNLNQRRKTAANAIASGLGLPKDKVIAAIEAAGFDARIRPEALTLEDFAAVQRELK